VIIQAGVLMTMDPRNRFLQPGWIRVIDEKIEAVSAEPIAPTESEETIDASSMAVMPGLVNTHTHLFQGLLRAVYDELPLVEYLSYIYRCGTALSPADCKTAAELGALEAIKSGVTTVTDHHFLNRGHELAAGTADGILATGVRAVVARTHMDIGAGLPDEIKETSTHAIEAVEALSRQFHTELAEHRLTLMTGPNTPGINASDKACIAISEFARATGLRSSAHVSEYAGVGANVRALYGVDGVVRWLSGLGVLGPDLLAVHAVHVDDAEVGLLADAGVTVSHNPFSNLFCGNGIAPVDQMLQAGLVVGLGTDGAANNNGQGILDVVRITRLLQRSRPDQFAISPLQAMRFATIDGARALGIDTLVGSLEPGKYADLVMVAMDEPHMVPRLSDPINHLAHFAKGSDIRIVIINGRVVLRDREFVDVDAAAVLAQAQEAATRLVQRLS
jgi:5-methylthioadenosine/S-adenosylhomocysteine deaminase